MRIEVVLVKLGLYSFGFIKQNKNKNKKTYT